MIFNLFFIISFFILIIGSFYILNKSKKIENNNEPSDGYLKARKIFVRDPEAFKDKDQDGIDDIIDDKIN